MFSIVIYGYNWLFIIIDGCGWLLNIIHGYELLLIVILGDGYLLTFIHI